MQILISTFVFRAALMGNGLMAKTVSMTALTVTMATLSTEVVLSQPTALQTTTQTT